LLNEIRVERIALSEKELSSDNRYLCGGLYPVYEGIGAFAPVLEYLSHLDGNLADVSFFGRWGRTRLRPSMDGR
jgi:hypothetical protein